MSASERWVLAEAFDRAAPTYDAMVALSPGYHDQLRTASEALVDRLPAYGADVGRMPLINSYRPLRGSTVRNALVAFRGAHDAMRRYDHGDCQAFADELIHRLTGQRTGFGHADIDFM